MKKFAIVLTVAALAIGGLFLGKQFTGNTQPPTEKQDDKAGTPAPAPTTKAGTPGTPVADPTGPAVSKAGSTILMTALADLLTYKDAKKGDFEVNESGKPAHFALKGTDLDLRQKGELAQAVTDENKRDGIAVEAGDIHKAKFVLSTEGDRIRAIHVHHYGKDKEGKPLVADADRATKVALTIILVSWDQAKSEAWVTEMMDQLAANPKFGPPDRGAPHIRHLTLIRSRFQIIEK